MRTIFVIHIFSHWNNIQYKTKIRKMMKHYFKKIIFLRLFPSMQPKHILLEKNIEIALVSRTQNKFVTETCEKSFMNNTWYLTMVSWPFTGRNLHCNATTFCVGNYLAFLHSTRPFPDSNLRSYPSANHCGSRDQCPLSQSVTESFTVTQSGGKAKI